MTANIRQIEAFVAVSETGSFTAAARREHATQSGVSQHIAALEKALGAALVNRRRDGVVLTVAGQAYYEQCLHALRALHLGEVQVRTISGQLSGSLTVGLMPAFTRAALAPALQRYARQHPQVAVQITEAYSGALTDMVLAGQLDFALVPAARKIAGVRVTPLATDTEMLVSSVHSGLKPLAPVVLSTLAPLKLIVPGKNNVRRRNVQQYLENNGVQVARLMEMDAMLGTLELVACSDWMTILPGLILVADRGGSTRVINPIAQPALPARFVVIEPARRTLSVQAELFLEELRTEILAITAAPE